MKPTPGPWTNDSMKFSSGWRCVVGLPGGRAIDVSDPRNGETQAEDFANAELIASAPQMLRLLRDAKAFWIHNENPPKGSVSWEICELLKKFPDDQEVRVLGTAADLIDLR